jgi:peroxiredoxin
MTQPPANLLLRIEQLLNVGNIKDARVLLVDFIQSNPNSARAWWLLSMTVVDVDRQVACLKRVLRLDPENKLAQQRLSRLNSQRPAPASVSPFTSSFMGETEEITDDMSIIPDWAKPVGSAAESKPPQPPVRTPEPSVMPPAPAQFRESPVQPASSTEQGVQPAMPSASTEHVAASITPLMPGETEPPSAVPPSSLAPEVISTQPAPVSEPGEAPTILEPIEPVVVSAVPPSNTAPEVIPTQPAFVSEPDESPTKPPEPIEPVAVSAVPPAIIEQEAVSPEPTLISEPEVSASPPAVPVETEVVSAVPLAIIEQETVSPPPTPVGEPEVSAIQPPIHVETEVVSAMPPAIIEQEAVSPPPTPVGEPEVSAIQPPTPVEPALVSTGPTATIAPEVISIQPAPVSEPIELHPAPPSALEPQAASPIPTTPVEPKTVSAKRALFSELDKSFYTPPVPVDEVAATPPPPIPVKMGGTSKKLVPSLEPAAAPPKPPVPMKPAGKESVPRSPSSRWEMVYIMLAAFIILAVVAVVGYIEIQKKAQAQVLALSSAQPLQETLAVAQTLTNLPLPTLISTWTPSVTNTGLPTATFTITPTFTPTVVLSPTRTPPPSNLVGPVAGLFAPDFSLTDLASGRQVTLSQYNGQPVFIFYWATWCLNCNEEMGSIEAISQTNKDAGLVVLTVNAEEDIATLNLYRTNHNLTVPILLDPDSIFKSAYTIDLKTIPLHFFIDSIGRIMSIRMGGMTLAELQIQVNGILQRLPTSTP